MGSYQSIMSPKTKSTKKNYVIESDYDSSSDEREIIDVSEEEEEEPYNGKDEIEYSDEKEETESSDDDTEDDIEGGKLKPEYMKKYPDGDMRNIMFSDVEGTNDFAHGKFGNILVIMMKKNGYINASHLCGKANKRFYDWKKLDSSKRLIRALREMLAVKKKDLITKVSGGHITSVRGSYVHTDLIVHIACWCNEKYALKVSEIISCYHTDSALEEKDKLLKKKNDKIDKLGKKIDKQSQKIDVLLKNNVDLQNKNEWLQDRIDLLIEQTDDIMDQNRETHTKLELKIYRR